MFVSLGFDISNVCLSRVDYGTIPRKNIIFSTSLLIPKYNYLSVAYSYECVSLYVLCLFACVCVLCLCLR